MRGYVEKTFGSWVPNFQKEVIAKSFDPVTHQIIMVDGEPAGILAALAHNNFMQLEKLYLYPQFQGCGIGSHVVREPMQIAVSSSKPVRLRVLAVNTGARRMYERLGFVVYRTTAERIFMEYNP